MSEITYIGSRCRAPSTQSLTSGPKNPKIRSKADLRSLIVAADIPFASHRLACRRKYESMSM